MPSTNELWEESAFPAAARKEIGKAIGDPELPKDFGESTKLSEGELSVLLEAHSIVSKRNDAYGEPTDTAERVAAAFSALTKRVIKPADVALIQILFKIVRSEHGYKRDNNVDLAGYTDIRERCLVKERNGDSG